MCERSVLKMTFDTHIKIIKKMTHVHNCFSYYEFLACDVVLGEMYIIEMTLYYQWTISMLLYMSL